MSVGRHGLIAALDVGSTKVCCFIARAEGDRVRVVGIGHQAAAGVRQGAITDMEAAEDAVRAAVDAAERMAGETVREAYVNLSGGFPASHIVGVEVAIAGHAVRDCDVGRVLHQARVEPEGGERQVVLALPVGYTIDGTSRIRDPRGLYGDRLGVNLHIVTAASGPIRNLSISVERGHLGVAGLVPSSYAAGLAALVEDETDLGVTLIDMGGGTTKLVVFYEGALVHTDLVPLGGGHVTSDIARGLSTPLAHAERMKTLYGGVAANRNDENHMITVPQVGEPDDETARHIPRSALVGIVRPRIEETIEMVRDRLKASGFDRAAGGRVVLTGGACQLQGVRDMAARMLDKQVRIGRPIRIQGLAEATCGPAFATCAGLLAYALRHEAETLQPVAEAESGGRLARIGRWLKENF